MSPRRPHGLASRTAAWLVPHFDEDTARFMEDLFDEADAFVLGRHTYDIFAASWPSISDRTIPSAAV